MTAKRIYGINMGKIKNFIYHDGITAIQQGKKPLRRRLSKELHSGKDFIYTNVENALEAFSDGSLGGLWIMP